MPKIHLFPAHILLVVALAALTSSCAKRGGNSGLSSDSQGAVAESPYAEIRVESPLPTERLNLLKKSLPKVAYPALQQIFLSSQTVWYDHESLSPSYQASISQSPPYGANSNDRWFDLVASPVRPTAQNFYDAAKKRWRFPFATTAGTDQATNLRVFNFLWLPSKNGKLLPLAAGPKPEQIQGFGFSMNSWGWIYPNGAVLGELLFVTGTNGELLPSEVRIRTRYANGWAVNVYRPFPSAASLASSIKQRRPSWQSDVSLKLLVDSLENPRTLVQKSLKASQLPGTFSADGALDILPEIQDQQLVRELLTETTFVSSYGAIWKSGDGRTTYAATATKGLSIVPANYEAGLIQVSEDSCMRCHRDTGRGLTTFRPDFGDIILYGEMWGRDGIFSFHPFDESQYSVFWLAGTTDNRRMNPRFERQGIVARFNASVHSAPDYPETEVGRRSNTPGDDGSVETFKPGQSGSNSEPPSTSKYVEFHIPAGTGSGDWNSQNSPAVAHPGQIVRIINDDNTGHTLHTDGQPCPHGDTSRKVMRGEHYDCEIPARVQRGTLYRLWDHELGGPNSSRFWVRIE